MGILQNLSKWSSSLAASLVGGGYDAAKNDNRRRTGTGVLRSEDDELRPHDRKVLLSSTQSVYRNFAVARWMIARHLDYVSTFSFQAKTGDEELDKKLESLVDWWSHSDNFEITGRFNRGRFTRMAELQRVLNGDFFALKLRSGKVQAIEGERIRTPYDTLPNGLSAVDLIHGVRVDNFGRPVEYVCCKRGKTSDMGGGSSRFLFDKVLKSRNVIPFGYYDRFDQVRGVSPLAAAINSLSDVYESFDYALSKAKISQILGLVFYRENLDAAGDPLADTDYASDEEDETDTGEPKYGKMKWNNGPIQLDLDPGDRAEFLESKNPSTESQAFWQLMIQIALKALDIPYSFFAENYTNYSGARQALLQYEDSCKSKREDVREMLNRLTWWRCMVWMQDGHLDVPPDALRWEWIPSGMPWIDPLKEVNANIAAIGAGLASRTQVLREKGGREFRDVAREIAAENKFLESLGLPTNLDVANVQINEVAGK